MNKVDDALLETAYTLGANTKHALWLLFRASFPGVFGSFRILYDVTATTPGARFYYNTIRKGSEASDERVIDLATGALLPFEVVSPQVDESPQPGETPVALALRLAVAKAHAVARQHPDAIVIGSDQVADLNGTPIGKPGTHAHAVAQLQAMRGQMVRFHTAVAVVRPRTGFSALEVSTVTVTMGRYSDDALETYLHIEQPYDCAGSAKSEGIGVTLLEQIDSNDPTALVGLPLIVTTRLLRQAGLDLLARRAALNNIPFGTTAPHGH